MGRLPAGRLDRARRRVDRLFEEVDRIELTADVARLAADLADEHALRAYDAVHLASLETIADPETVLLAADGDLRRAARARGFAVLRVAP